ncbi:hypothetical protein IU487_34230 [Nocardia puris]|uniref:hypothetical protein n=1 Tax=Nocardia puris TaxID=208602 RepID=UPI00189522DE|nr:hypothetical protein [Nocardia puris]MBF6216058.1 hypothetical protein [Nocardia puris]
MTMTLTREVRFEFDRSAVAYEALCAFLGRRGPGAIAAIAGYAGTGREQNSPKGNVVFFPNSIGGRRELVAFGAANAEAGLNTFLNSALWPDAVLDATEPHPLGKEFYSPIKFPCLWGDIDTLSKVPRPLWRELRRKGCVVVKSGGVGEDGKPSHHIRLYLKEPITDVHEFHRLNGWLAKALGADSKWNAYAWLTLPGMIRFKPNEYPEGRDIAVQQIERGAWTVAELEALFALYAPTPRVVRVADDAASIVAEAVSWDALPRPVRHAWANGFDDESRGLWNYLCLCAEYGMSQGAALHWAIEGRDAGQFPARHSDVSLRTQTSKAFAEVEANGKLNSKSTPETRRKAKARRKDAGSGDDRGIEDFWTARPELTHIRDFALSRRRSPWGVLGVVLARLSTVIPPNYVLPPDSASHGSLNTYVGLIGVPGAGKSATIAAARDAVYVGEVYTPNIGSGEGIAHRYAYYDEKGKDLVPTRDAVLFTCDEIGRLRALMTRAGSTLMSELLTAWSGGPLGFASNDQNLWMSLGVGA